MKKSLVIIGVLFGSLFLSGCYSYSQYLLTVEYTNPNTNSIERIDIPVSQYIYDKTGVGHNYDVTIKTVALGIRVPKTDDTSSSRLALLDILPIAVAAFAVLFPILSGRRRILDFVPSVVIGFGICLLLISTTSPEFSTIGIVIDKTFQIVS